MSDDENDVPVVVRNREGPNPYGLTASTLGGYSTFNGMIKQYLSLFPPAEGARKEKV